jgi:hypothetical protein
MYGSTLLSEYFDFSFPKAAQLKKQKIVAAANGFSLNSQAALMYYDSNITVKNDYQQFYMVGWPGLLSDYTIDDGKGGVVTGGDAQRNPAHILELICAFAAYDFFKSGATFNNKIHEWQFKSAEEETTGKLKFDFSDLIGTNEADTFKLKLTAFFSMSLMINNEYRKNAFLSFYDTVNNNGKISGTITAKESEAIDAYIKHFAFYYDHNTKKVVPGWLFQVRKSTGSTSFLFEETAFSENYRELTKVEWCNILPEHHFVSPYKYEFLRRFVTVSFDRFKDKVVKNTGVNFGGISKANEKLFKWIYDTYSKALEI